MKTSAERNEKMYQHSLQTMNNISYDRQRELEKVRYQNYLQKLVSEGMPAKENLDILKPFRAFISMFLNIRRDTNKTIYRQHELNCQSALTPCA